jgi:acyl-CoA thioesterase-1
MGSEKRARNRERKIARAPNSHRALPRQSLLAFAGLMCVSAAGNAAPLRIVAIGASNTHGWYVGNQGAYPAQLETLLRAKGIDARVTNAGVSFEKRG